MVRNRRRSVVPLVISSILALPIGTAAAAPTADERTVAPGLARILSTVSDPAAAITAVATFRDRPSPADLGALSRLGLAVQGLEHLPLALVAGPVSLLRAAVQSRAAVDVYPNERMRYYADEPAAADTAVSIRDSGTSIGVDKLHARGLTGKGVGVAVVDSGVDASHPDLAGNVAHSVKIVGPGYPYYPSKGPTFVLPVESQGANTDLVSGHGTHVAGIVAADGTTAPDQVGVAPKAALNAYSVGEVFVHTVLGAFDHILEHHAERNIRVVNNSWGAPFRLFDPADPINVATKALADAGLVVVFAAGNDGAEMTINSFSVAPWVISVGSNTVAGKRSKFSSRGLAYDNSKVASGLLDGHRRFTGARPGLYHPDVSAPGSDISSSAAGSGLLAGPNPPCRPAAGNPCRATLSGTSMAAPHVAGLAALVLQARPSLTSRQVRLALQATATPIAGARSLVSSGYGIVHARSVALVARTDFSPSRLAEAQRAADRRIEDSEKFRTRFADHWSFPAPPVSAAGLDPRDYDVEVTRGTDALKIAVAFPALPPPVLLPVPNFGGYLVILTDAAGREVGRALPGRTSTTVLFVDLKDHPAAFGTWRLRLLSVALLGVDSLSPELPGEPPFIDVVSVTMAQLGAAGGR